MTGEFAIAVHAMAYLEHTGKTESSETLADNICTNAARVRKVMSKLRKADLISTKEGAEGGYCLTLNPSSVTLRQIFDALDQKLISTTWRSGDPDRDCMISSGMSAVMEGLYDELDILCRERLSQITVHDIAQKLTLRAHSKPVNCR